MRGFLRRSLIAALCLAGLPAAAQI